MSRFLVPILASLVGCRHPRCWPRIRPGRPTSSFVFTDDQGYGDVGCYGAKGFRTPNLDRMAAEGIRFTDFYVAQARLLGFADGAVDRLLSESRSAFSGLSGPRPGSASATTRRTIAQVLKTRATPRPSTANGTSATIPQFLPTRHGFDDYFGLPYSNDMSPRARHNKIPPLPLYRRRQDHRAQPRPCPS